jgi:hypothetical protein
MNCRRQAANYNLSGVLVRNDTKILLTKQLLTLNLELLIKVLLANETIQPIWVKMKIII